MESTTQKIVAGVVLGAILGLGGFSLCVFKVQAWRDADAKIREAQVDAALATLKDEFTNERNLMREQMDAERKRATAESEKYWEQGRQIIALYEQRLTKVEDRVDEIQGKCAYGGCR